LVMHAAYWQSCHHRANRRRRHPVAHGDTNMASPGMVARCIRTCPHTCRTSSSPARHAPNTGWGSCRRWSSCSGWLRDKALELAPHDHGTMIKLAPSRATSSIRAA
jgi:hypothetical protein